MVDLAIYMPAAGFMYGQIPRDSDSIRTGGAELQTSMIATGLAERGWGVAHIIYPHDGPLRPDFESKVELVARGPHRNGPWRLGKLRELGVIWSSLREANGRACLFRGSGIQLAVGAVFSRARGRKLIFSAANDLDFTFDRNDRSATYMSVYRRALLRVDAVVVQTPTQVDLAERSGVDPDRISLIPSFAEEAPRSEQEPRGFTWIGRRVGYKRPDLFIEIARKRPDTHFRMVSPATNETSTEIDRMLDEAGRELPNLEVLAALPRERVLELIAESHAVVSTSDYEGMPNVFLEAWARGVPVISLSLDPNGLISERGLGYRCEGSMDSMGAAIDELRERPCVRAEFADRVRSYVRQVHSIDAIAKQWGDVLAGQLGGKGHPGAEGSRLPSSDTS